MATIVTVRTAIMLMVSNASPQPYQHIDVYSSLASQVLWAEDAVALIVVVVFVLVPALPHFAMQRLQQCDTSQPKVVKFAS